MKTKIDLSELTLENLGQWPFTVKVGALAGLGVLLIALGYWLFPKGIFDEYASLQAQEAGLKTEFENKGYQASNLETYKNQINLMKERFGAMLRQLPAKNEMPGLLEEISKNGVASGLKFTLFAPQKEVVHDFYIELPIKMTVRGTYFQLAQFMSRVAEMRRIVTLHEFSIEGASSLDNKTISEDELIMNLTAKIYRYRSK